VIATGRSDRFPQAPGSSVRGQPWFEAAMRTSSGRDFAVADVGVAPLLGGAQVATYSTAIREGRMADGAALGALGIFFDWAPQAEAVLGGVCAFTAERVPPRVMILDASRRVIASSDGRGTLSESFPLRTDGRSRGHYRSGDALVAFAERPGYETYRGRSWYGVDEWREKGWAPLVGG
jgi:hypothetical protein